MGRISVEQSLSETNRGLSSCHTNPAPDLLWRRFRLRFHRATDGQLSLPDTVYLFDSDWDDYSFQTIFQAVYLDWSGTRRPIGSLKIGQYGLQPHRGPNPPAGFGRPALPTEFPELDRNVFFSLGQDSTYYENINQLDAEVRGFRERYLGAVNDIPFRGLLVDVLGERVMQRSLLRTVSVATVRDQFTRLARGDSGLVRYNLHFPIRDDFEAPTLQCSVEPNSLPPENIRVLIGRNGAGKSTTLRQIENMLISGARDYAVEEIVARQRAQLAKLVSVSFSAFDAFKHLSDGETGKDDLTYHYVGLQCDEQSAPPPEDESEDVDPWSPQPEPIAPQRRTRTSAELTDLIIDKVAYCSGVEELWRRLCAALYIIEGDPNFAEFGITDIVLEGESTEAVRSALQPVVEEMSSGHKIVLLTLARLVETVAEKTLVLFDEPESHLHPPLLSALVRALSDLLADRNGLAIIATHSPVVLQEVPKSCVFIIENSPAGVTLSSPELETFGENVGTLTAAVFGLEVTRTGFYAMLRNVADEETDYPAALRRFRNQLGAEGRAILRSMTTTRTQHADDVGN